MSNEWLSQRGFVLQSASNVGKPCPNNTSWSDFTSNLTHLHLESKGLRLISNLESCYAVRVLYLYNNRIDSISGLENLRQLTHLYLQVCGLVALARVNMYVASYFTDAVCFVCSSVYHRNAGQGQTLANPCVVSCRRTRYRRLMVWAT